MQSGRLDDGPDADMYPRLEELDEFGYVPHAPAVHQRRHHVVLVDLPLPSGPALHARCGAEHNRRQVHGLRSLRPAGGVIVDLPGVVLSECGFRYPVAAWSARGGVRLSRVAVVDGGDAGQRVHQHEMVQSELQRTVGFPSCRCGQSKGGC